MNELMLFHFLRPWWLLGLIPLVMIAWRLWHQRDVAQNWNAICDAHLLPHLLTEQTMRQRSRWPLYLALLAWLVTMLALAGPTWTKRTVPAYQPNAGTVFILDLSPSMLAEDIKPSRLERAKFKLLDLLKEVKKTTVGLVVFAGEAYTVSPLTQDANTIASMVPVLSPSIMPTTGDQMSSALKLADNLIEQSGAKPANVVLMTDSQPTDKGVAAAKKLAQQGVHLYVLGIGKDAKAPIKLPSGNLMRDSKGEIVMSHFDEAALQKLAQTGDGRYVPFTAGNIDVKQVISLLHADHAPHMKEVKAQTEQWDDEGRWFIVFIVLLALLGFRRGWWQEVIRQ